MASWELFEAQSQEYRDSVLPPSIQARLAVEASVTQGWRRYIGNISAAMSLGWIALALPLRDQS